MGAMFYRSDHAHPDVSAWNTTQVSDMQAMFAGMTYPPRDLSNWDFSNARKMDEMFDGVSLPVPVYSALLLRIAVTTQQSKVNFNGGNSYYDASAAVARQALVVEKEWQISDLGVVVE